MYFLTEFALFSRLPIELRFKIWRLSLPKRVLQLGVDVPLPFLRKHENNSSGPERWVLPIPFTLPSTFHVCHDSRTICLEEYIPFGYSYIHPSLDTLYISRLAGTWLYHNICKIHKAARPPLYPIALLDTVAMEIWTGDIPRQAGSDECSIIMEHVLLAMLQFGPPKELLIVKSEDTGFIWTKVGLPGYSSIELTEIGEGKPWAPGEVEELVKFVRNRLQVGSEKSPWLQWRIPEIRCADAQRQRRKMRIWADLPKYLPAADAVVKKWNEEVWELHRADWDWDLHGHPYYLENMEKALAQYHQGLKGGVKSSEN